MGSFLTFSIPPWPDASFIDRGALFQLGDNDLKFMMCQCELALSCIKDEVKRREKPGSLEPSLSLWRTIQHYHRPPPPSHQKVPEDEEWFLSVIRQERLSGLPKSIFVRLSDSDKATIVQLSLGPWSVNSVANLANAPSRSSLGQPPAFHGELRHANTSSEHLKLSRLSSDALLIVKLIAFAGGAVPQTFFWDARASKSWGSDGEIRLQKPTPAGIFESSERCEQAIQQLLQCDAVERRNNANYFAVKPALQSYIMSKASRADDCRMMALTATIYAFPKDSCMEPVFFTRKGLSMISILMFVLPYIWDIKQPTAEFLELAFETLFSSSQFADIIWKRTALGIAEQIAHLLRNPIYLLRINFRKTVLSRLLNHTTPLPYSLSVHPGIDTRTNAWLGQFRLHQAQVLIDRGASTDVVSTELSHIRLLDSTRPSHQERTVLLESKFLIAKSLRFEGKFNQALPWFDYVLQEAYRYGSRISWRVAPHIAETQSEVGSCQKAIDLVHTTIQDFTEYNSMDRGNGKRLRLALANCHLMRLLWSSAQGMEPDAEALRQTLDKFRLLATQFNSGTGLLSKHNKFVVYCGLAMTYDIGDNVKDSYSAWKEAADFAKSFWKEPGYAEMITTYSQSVAAFRLGRDDAEALSDKARELWGLINGRRGFYFTALGSIWPNVLLMFERRRGREGIIPWARFDGIAEVDRV